MKIRLKFWVVAVVALISGCEDLERSNPLDPKNPHGESPRFVLVENFINSSGGEPVATAVAALERLQNEFVSDRYLIVDHHIEKTPGTDPDAVPESLLRYQRLVAAPAGQGIPDILFDGGLERVQGATDETLAYGRCKNALERRLLEHAKYLIEAVIAGGVVRVKVARLGDTEEQNMLVKMIVAEEAAGRNIVRDIITVGAIGRIKPGEVRQLSADLANNSVTAPLTAVIFLEDESRHFIKQAAIGDIR